MLFSSPQVIIRQIAYYGKPTMGSLLWEAYYGKPIWGHADSHRQTKCIPLLYMMQNSLEVMAAFEIPRLKK